MSLLLEARGLRKRFGTRVLLDGADLELERGASKAHTGDNGCGKSTLLRVLSGFEPGAADALRFDGRPVLLSPYPEALRHQIIYVHQHPYLFRSSVRENIAYGLRARGYTRREAEPLVEETIAWAGVGHLLGVPPHKLSGGEKQRVALARARVLQPRLFLLDEPTANLDHEARAQVLDLIEHLRAADVTLLIACHDTEIVCLPGMRRLALADGRIHPVPVAVGRAPAANGQNVAPMV